MIVDVSSPMGHRLIMDILAYPYDTVNPCNRAFPNEDEYTTGMQGMVANIVVNTTIRDQLSNAVSTRTNIRIGAS